MSLIILFNSVSMQSQMHSFRLFSFIHIGTHTHTHTHSLIALHPRVIEFRIHKMYFLKAETMDTYRGFSLSLLMLLLISQVAIIKNFSFAFFHLRRYKNWNLCDSFYPNLSISSRAQQQQQQREREWKTFSIIFLYVYVEIRVRDIKNTICIRFKWLFCWK